MERVERTVVRKGDANYLACVRLCSASKRLGNCTAYLLRHKVFDELPIGSKSQTDQQVRELYSDDYKAMPSAASAQRQTQVIYEQFSSFYAALASYKKNPEKFKGEPKLPGYSKKYRAFYVARNGYKIENGLLTITGGKEFGLNPIKVLHCQNQAFSAKSSEAVCGDLRICPKGNCFIIEITYTIKEPNWEQWLLLDHTQYLAVDLGLDNIVACISTKTGVPPLLVKGGSIKSVNQWWNKRVAELQSGGKSQCKHIRNITFKRNNQVSDLIHKVAHAVVSYCIAWDLGNIIIGKNSDWKQHVNMGKVNNQKFCNIPFSKLVSNITYLAEECGIKVIVREESYTSKASALDLDKMPPSYQKNAVCNFSGKRIQRGLYRTSTGSLINADLNGALNIARKELGDEWLCSLIANGGFVDKPVVIRNLHQKADAGALLKARQRSCETSHVSA